MTFFSCSNCHFESLFDYNQVLDATGNLAASSQCIQSSTDETLQHFEKSGETLVVVRSLLDRGKLKTTDLKLTL